MKKILFTLFIAFTFMYTAKAVVVIQPDQGTGTNALTAAVDANPTETVFELVRNGVYFVNKAYTFTRAVTLRAQTGTGAMPIVDVVTDNTGAKPSQLFYLQANITISGIYFNGDTRGSGIVSHFFRGSTANLTVSFDGCYFDKIEQTVMRFDAAGNSATFTNCIFRNIAQTANIDNGRIVDSRSLNQNNVSFTNCTFYNNVGQVYRYGASNTINNLLIDHCTFYNSAYRMSLDFSIKGTYTNNIMANCGWKGIFSADNGTTPPVATYLNSNAFVDSLKTSVDATRSFVVSNNNIYDTPDLTAAYAAYPTKVLKRPLVFTPNAWITNNQFTMANNISEALQFTNPSAMTIDFVKAYFASSGSSSFNTTSNLPYYVEETAGIDAPDVTTPFSFTYQGTAQSAKASTTGGPLGDIRWAPTETGINQLDATVSVNIFPNPVTDFLNLTFGESASVKVNIFDMQGRTVYFNNHYRNVNSGETIQIDMQKLSSGTYLYSVEAMVNGSLRHNNGKITK